MAHRDVVLQAFIVASSNRCGSDHWGVANEKRHLVSVADRGTGSIFAARLHAEF
jgi:hypothetical protein